VRTISGLGPTAAKIRFFIRPLRRQDERRTSYESPTRRTRRQPCSRNNSVTSAHVSGYRGSNPDLALSYSARVQGKYASHEEEFLTVTIGDEKYAKRLRARAESRGLSVQLSSTPLRGASQAAAWGGSRGKAGRNRRSGNLFCITPGRLPAMERDRGWRWRHLNSP
jgi:hypothetical protein